jgi:hypothetical protein
MTQALFPRFSFVETQRYRPSSIPAPASFVHPNSSPHTRCAARTPMPPGFVLDFQHLLVVAKPI